MTHSERQEKHIAVIVAAGRGTRMQADKPKVLLELAGRPVLAHTLDAFVNCPWMDAVIVVAASEYQEIGRARSQRRRLMTAVLQ